MGCTAEPSVEPPDLEVEVVRSPPVCADPSARATQGPWARVELGADWTFDPDYHTARWRLQRGARGVVVADLNGDGHLDLVVPQVLEPTRLLWGDGRGGFTEGALPALPELTGPSGGSAGDLDGDGDLDLFVYGQESSAVVLVNDGAGGFSGTAHPEWDGEFVGCGGSASWGDYDLDGDLDVYWGRLGMSLPTGEAFFCGNRLLRNDGGVLVDASDELPFDSTQLRVLASGFLPLDDDPEPELYLVVDAEMEDLGAIFGSNLVLDRVGGRWEAWSNTGLEVVTAGMGLAVGDADGDGTVDVMVPGVDELFVLMSVGGGMRQWADNSAITHLAPDLDRNQHSGWGGEWEDVDYDGLLDLVVTYGAFADATQQEPDEVYRAKGDGTYEPVGEAWGFADRFPSRGFAIADLNEDGWPDVVKRELGGVLVLYLSRCGEQHWVQISLDQGGDTGGSSPSGLRNLDAIGAEVVVVAGGERRVRYVTAGSTSYQIGGPPVVQVGLGDLDQVDDIEVTWPDGTVGRSGPVDVDQWVELHR